MIPKILVGLVKRADPRKDVKQKQMGQGVNRREKERGKRPRDI